MANQVTGKAYIRVDGALLRSKDDAKLNIGGQTRSAVVGNDVHGYTEETTPPELECSISHMADTRLETLRNITDATITFESDTGPVYVLRHAWLVDPPALTAKGGEVALKFQAITCEEQS
jgi:hypothetical protein